VNAGRGERAIRMDGVTVLVLDTEGMAALRHLLVVTVGVGTIPVDSELEKAELGSCLRVLNQLRRR
jgi:hypothetical protein